MGSLDRWIDEAELITAAYPPACHLLAALKQGRSTLEQLILSKK